MLFTKSIVPNFFTLMNVFMGFYSIILMSQGKLFESGMAVLTAAVFDSLDGVVARLLKATSELGAELDSLCDAVSFGIAPAFMLYTVYFHQFETYGVILAALPALAGVTRLARFNINLVSFDDKLYFTGLPIPGAALTILSFLLFFKDSVYFDKHFEFVTYILISVLVSYAMISTIKFDNLPRFSKRYIKKKPVVFSIFIIGVIFCIATKGIGIFPFMVFYIVVSAIRHMILWIKSTINAEDEIDENENKKDFTQLD